MSNHDWRTKNQVYVSSDTPLPNPGNCGWSKPPREDQRIITRGVARKGAELEVLNTRLEIVVDGDKTLELVRWSFQQNQRHLPRVCRRMM